MDNINSQIGQNIAREQASIINEKSFNTNQLLGMQTGVSQFTKSENPALAQQVKNLDKSASQLSEQQRADEQKKLKNSAAQADKLLREESFDLSSELASIDKFLQTKGTAISFSIDEATDKQVVTIREAASGDVIRQIPTAEVLNFAERMRELQSDVSNQVGVLIDRQV